MRDLVDIHYPHAHKIRVPLDNLSAHSAGALCQAFDQDEVALAMDISRRSVVNDLTQFKVFALKYLRLDATVC